MLCSYLTSHIASNKNSCLLTYFAQPLYILISPERGCHFTLGYHMISWLIFNYKVRCLKGSQMNASKKFLWSIHGENSWDCTMNPNGLLEKVLSLPSKSFTLTLYRLFANIVGLSFSGVGQGHMLRLILLSPINYSRQLWLIKRHNIPWWNPINSIVWNRV